MSAIPDHPLTPAEVANLQHACLDHEWLQFTQMQSLSEQGVRIAVDGEGCLVRDALGREYIDALAGIFTTTVGHRRREILDAMSRQMNKLEFFPCFGGWTNIPSIRLAEKLSRITPGDLTVSFLVSGGSEAVETAFKIARQYFAMKRQGKRYKIISRKRAYHGATLGALSANGWEKHRSFFEPLAQGFVHIEAPYCYRCPFGREHSGCTLDCIENLERTIQFEGPETVAAFIAEPVMGAAAGVLIPPPEYFPRVREICDRYGVLLILDEVITGFGRTGKMFAAEHWNVVPDIMVLAKGITSGYFPVGAAVVRDPIAQTFLGGDERRFYHGYSYGGHPIGAAAALANIEVIEREDLVRRSAEMGCVMLEQLRTLTSHAMVGDVRGLGLFFCIELVKDKGTKELFAPEQAVGDSVCRRAYELGVIARNEWDKIVLCPPLVITERQMEQVVQVLDRSINDIGKHLR